MNAQLGFDLPPTWRLLATRDERDWLDVFREAEAEAELAAGFVRTACEAYKAERSPATVDAYRAADKAYDAARLRFQQSSFKIVSGIRAIAGIARAIELADASRGRMI